MKVLNYLPMGMNVKSAILFSMFLMILSCPLFRNIPELVRTLWTWHCTEKSYKFALFIVIVLFYFIPFYYTHSIVVSSGWTFTEQIFQEPNRPINS